MFRCYHVYAMVLAVSGATNVQAGPYSAAVLTNSPLGYYRMDEVSGSTALDSSGVAQNGIYRDGSVTSATPPGPGPVLSQVGPRPATFSGFEANNNAVFFDGVRLDDSDDLFFDPAATDNLTVTLTGLNDNDYSFEAWIYNTGFSGNPLIKGYVGGRGQTSTAMDALGIMGSFVPADTGKLFLFNGNGAGQLITGTTVLAEDTWYHVAYTRSGTNVAVYVNGALEASSAGFSNTYGTDDTIVAGMRPDGWFAYEGRIDELAIYDGALSGTQIEAHYDAAFVPEPGSFAMLAFGSIASGLCRRRRVACPAVKLRVR